MNGFESWIFIRTLLEQDNAIYSVTIVDDLAIYTMQCVAHLAETDLGSLDHGCDISMHQLQQTEAEITNTNAQYQYRLTLAALNFQTGMQP